MSTSRYVLPAIFELQSARLVSFSEFDLLVMSPSDFWYLESSVSDKNAQLLD